MGSNKLIWAFRATNLWHDIILSVAEVALKLARLGGRLHGSLDIIIGAALGEADSQVNDGHIGSGHAEGHAGELSVEFGDDFAHGLGSAGGGGDDVLACTAATAPVLGRKDFIYFLHKFHGLGKGGGKESKFIDKHSIKNITIHR